MFTEANALLILALVLAIGVAFGQLAAQLRLPAVTGQLLVGVAIGPFGIGFFEHDAISSLEPMTHFALGLIAVVVGSHLQVRRLRNAAKRLLTLLMLEATVTPVLVFLSLVVLTGIPWIAALLLATIAVSTAPATVVALVNETRSKGVFVNTLLAAVALNNIACIVLFELARGAARIALDSDGPHGTLDAVLASLTQLAASAALGALGGLTLLVATWRIFQSDRLTTASVIAILLTSGLADYLGVSPLLSCLFFGMTLANVRPSRDEIGHRAFDDFQSAILAVFFTLAGMELDFQYLVPAGVIALVFVGSRLSGKILASELAMRMAGATERIRKNLGLALFPQAGLAVGLLLFVQEDPILAPVSQIVLAVGVTGVLAAEIAGPLMMRIALDRSGDLGRDRARLFDFLHEENIVTDLVATTKAEALVRLLDLLIRSHGLRVNRVRLIASMLAQEKKVSSYVGGGLAVPHVILPEGLAVAGVMGLSQEGVVFGENADGSLVHAIVLVATPQSRQDFHLRIVAELSRVFGSDRNLRTEVFSAKSAAHVIEILNSEASSETFNPFLEDVPARRDVQR